MSRQVYVYRDGKMVPKAEAAPVYLAPRSISDGMDGLRHPVTGAIIDSKSRFRQITKDAGCVEVGNDVQRPQRKPDESLSRDVAEAYRMVRDGYTPAPVSRREWGENWND